MALVELHRAFIDQAVGGFPVVDEGQLVGVGFPFFSLTFSKGGGELHYDQ